MPMAARQVNAGLGTLQWILTAGAVYLAVDTTLLRPPLPRPRLTAADQAAIDESGPAEVGPSLDSLESIWRRDLRQTLVEPPPVATPKPQAPPPPPPVRLPQLRATFVERARAWGIFVDDHGQVRVRAAGGRIDDFEIVSIDAHVALLRRGGETHEVAVPKADVPQAIRTGHKGGR